MNTIHLNANASPAKDILRRFLWKEYRTLRGFWLAVGALAILAQSVVPWFAFSAQHVPGQVFAIAWGAATLFAVGAAITLFSAEREEQTHEFLMLLPGNWMATFVGKVWLAILSSIALAAILSLSGYLIAGGNWPTRAVANEVLGVLGIAILEATAWGLFFSLRMKQPLLAAILAMAVASLSAQIAVQFTSRPNQAFTTAAYSEAAPMRVLFSAGVFLLDLWLASRWLNPLIALGHSSARPRRVFSRAATNLSVHELATVAAGARPRRRRMFGRLLWQTWRESWKTMLAAVPISLLLIMSFSMAGWLFNSEQFSAVLTALVLPSLFGALAFHADQRAGHRQFLVAHAGRPRYVWLARHMVWLSALILIGLFVQLVASLLTAYGIREHLLFSLRYQYYQQSYLQSAWSTSWQMHVVAATFWKVAALGWSALLSAYGLGQLCSMLVRREVLAGFLALLLSAVLIVWTIIVGAWQLNPAWFLLPLAIGSLLATWLRAPDWILGRNQVRTRVKPLAALALSIVAIAVCLPASRQAQLPETAPSALYQFLDVPLNLSIARWNASTQAADQTSLDYERLQASLVPWEEATADVRVDGKSSDDLKSMGIESKHVKLGDGEFSLNIGGLDDELAFPPEQQEAFRRLVTAQQHAFAAANQDLIHNLEKISRSDSIKIPDSAFAWHQSDWWGIHGTYESLLINDASRILAEGKFNEAFENYLTVARLRGQLLAKRTSRQAENVIEWQQDMDNLDAAILEWAQHPGVTREQIKDAIAKLHQVFEAYPDPREAVLADYFWVRDILLDKRTPTFLNSEDHQLIYYLPYLPNQLSWERDRALRALDLLTTHNLNYVDAVSHLTEGGEIWNHQGLSKQYQLGDLLQPVYDNNDSYRNEVLSEGDWNRFTEIQKLAESCRSSFLVSEELERRGDLSSYLLRRISLRIRHRGLLTQMALIAYRHDHQEYPEKLDELVPAYLPWLLIDPYSRQAFEYRREGLDLMLCRDALNPQLSKLVPAGTPLFWSAGVFHLILEQKFSESEEIDDEQWHNGDEIPPGIDFYVLRPSSIFMRTDKLLVFPLPTDKADIAETTEANQSEE